MRAGLLHNQVNIKRGTYSVDSFGDRTRTLSNIVTGLWCSIKYIGTPSAGASEEETNDQTTGKIKIEVTCRYFGLGDAGNVGLKFDDVVEHMGGLFDIYSIHVIGRNELYKIRAELRDDSSVLEFSNLNAPNA
jgi:hypothetical protein